ncbi:MAG TPA: ABC transporter substrate-binding protein [Alphaproteobacteria bacterium]
MRRRLRRGLAVLIAAAALAGGTPAPRAETVLKVIPQADLRSLDPVWTTAAITLIHGYLVYDTLFGLDGHLQPKPQMVESYAASPDGLRHTFTLRPGLTFSDGSPVTARDAAASIRRWGARAVAGQALMPRVGELTATDERTVTLTLKEPFAPLLDVLADPVLPLFVMREKEALTDPFQQISETVGSGPFLFVKEEFRPGDRVVYVRNPGYSPRSEPPDGLSGAKLAKVDRIEWKVMPDTNIAVAALTAGEADFMEQPPFDLLPVLSKNNAIKLVIADPVGYQPMVRPNQLFPPFDKPAARRALLYLVDQAEYLTAMVGEPQYRIPCPSPFICGTPSESKVGIAEFARPNPDKARQLFKEAGYNGEPIVIMDPTDLPIQHHMTLLTADKLRQIGVNVELQAMDWSTLVARRPIKDPPSKDPRGWHLFHTTWPSMAMQNPITNSAVATPCDGKNWFGWACDEELERRRLAYLAARTDEDKKKAIDAIQERYFEVVPFVAFGQFLRPVAMRANVSGLLNAPYVVYWNIEKK